MSKQNVIAIFDIGKTNKKIFLFNEEYSIVLERNVQFEEISDEDGDACEDVTLLTRWVIETLKEVLRIKKFYVKAVNFSAYGASLVYINDEGMVLAPLYSYLKKYPEKIKNELYTKYGGAEKISCETASPVLDSLNSGMQLYRIMQERPRLYQQIKFALHLPQYISYLLTQVPYSDITSIGCHTQLWDYQKKNYHDWVTAEGIDKKLAPILSSEKTIEVFFSDKKLQAGAGLHDSSAALIPYLTVFTEPFVLISTGTWCISLNPFNNIPLTNDELKKDCLCYMGYQGNPVKASRLFAGHDHEKQVKKLSQYFNKPVEFYKKVKYDAGIVSALQKSHSFDRVPEKNEGILQQSNFDWRNLSSFNNYNEAYHCLVLDIVQEQFISTQLVIRNTNVNRIFVDGGFSNNSIYMHLLALAFPQLEVYAASVAQATAMGAALAIHAQWNTFPVPGDMIKLKYYKATNTLNVNV
jgi:sugar (pentulose or hexulose) kinase